MITFITTNKYYLIASSLIIITGVLIISLNNEKTSLKNLLEEQIELRKELLLANELLTLEIKTTEYPKSKKEKLDYEIIEKLRDATDQFIEMDQGLENLILLLIKNLDKREMEEVTEISRKGICGVINFLRSATLEQVNSLNSPYISNVHKKQIGIFAKYQILFSEYQDVLKCNI